MSDYYNLVMEEIYPSIRNRHQLPEQYPYMPGIHPEDWEAMNRTPTEQEEQQFQDFLKSL